MNHRTRREGYGVLMRPREQHLYNFKDNEYCMGAHLIIWGVRIRSKTEARVEAIKPYLFSTREKAQECFDQRNSDSMEYVTTFHVDLREKYEFKECAICAMKPGSPTLCDSCLANRTTIDRLNEKVEELEKERGTVKEILNLHRTLT